MIHGKKIQDSISIKDHEGHPSIFHITQEERKEKLKEDKKYLGASSIAIYIYLLGY